MGFIRKRSTALVTAVVAMIGVTIPVVVSSGPSAAATDPTVILPANNATVSGTSVVLDAAEPSGTTQVQFELLGGSLSNFTLIATATPTIYGWVAQWDSTTVANGSYYLFVFTQSGANAASQFTVNNAPPTPPSASLVLPSSGATVSGTTYLDALANPGSNNVAATGVDFFLIGAPDCQSLPGCQVGTATPTTYGWLSAWNTNSWPNGTYSLFAVAFFPNEVFGSSSAESVTVNNAPPTVVIPANGSSVSGSQLLDCASPPATSQVQFWLSGGTLSVPQLIGSATPTIYGWVYDWTTSSVTDGGYSLYCSATYPNDGTGQGPGNAVTVAN